MTIPSIPSTPAEQRALALSLAQDLVDVSPWELTRMEADLDDDLRQHHDDYDTQSEDYHRDRILAAAVDYEIWRRSHASRRGPNPLDTYFIEPHPPRILEQGREASAPEPCWLCVLEVAHSDPCATAVAP